ncbi:YlxQ family RNA-binding protein [Insulibacter thermoxylanivorax]|uniref:YlxQ family RNA-binding protein n=1 Tax=Insulibacter thermoxylanivorax TaxID=2749268 RepID=UPI0019104065|nr:YlxQ family RNA-binding protein [Insulibacter thermoxylanivorax]
MRNRFLSLLGLAQRAGKLAGGEEKALQAIQQGKAHLVILAVDASANTAKKFKDKCRYYQVPLIQEVDRGALGKATGRMERVVIAVMDEGFADAMLKSVE